MHSLSTGEYVKHGRSVVNPRLELRAVIEANMKLDRAAHARIFFAKMFSGSIDPNDLDDVGADLHSAVINSWFSHNYPSVLQDAETRELARMRVGTKRERLQAAKIEEKRQVAKAARDASRETITSVVKAEVTKKLAETASEIRKLMLLDTVVLPNGKKLRDATGDECGKAGGMLSRIAMEMTTRGVVHGLVGDNLTEKQVQKMLLGK